ncbi:golvesin C-terminal-like domain-containing protein [Bacteroides bouchesdurhonensis]|uniref:golvesin C-terminal-like domain-containing protein n=1 Tax=Bacteroides bouchesdurhonensis TaxID=1841855 RepID=UPI00097F773D|nr:xanthan lyase [Bacteroides bouchesdurhonensis]
MTFISNIQSVAKYESKLLIRSWFFRVFTVLAVSIVAFLNFGLFVSEDMGRVWIATSIPSNIPYLILLLLNTGQAVIAIFLASDFLKRDKKLDTSEVFYVRPLSNAEYVIGKIWGNLRVFLILNLIVIGITAAFNLTSGEVDWMSYIIYFLLISVPTLIFIIGLSIFLMLVLKNQALTFVILLGYIGLTVFYIEDKFYYLFDYMAYSLPLVKSTIVGFSNLGVILNHRAIYLFAGLAFVFFTICLFRRLPNSSRSNISWMFLAFGVILLSFTSGYWHIHSILYQSDIRAVYTNINNQYVATPKMAIYQYDLSVEQHPDNFSSEVTMIGTALESSNVFTFCLNPGLNIHSVHSGEHPLKFKRDKQIVLVDFGTNVAKGDTVSVTFEYDGQIDKSFCYLDIPPEMLQAPRKRFLFNIDKQYCFQTNNYLLLTPETYWYPRAGTSYSDKTPDWQQTYFSNYNLKVKPLPGLVPLSQGEGKSDEQGVYTFKGDFPSQTISLIIGNYQQKSVYSDSILCSIWHLEDHDYFTAVFDSIQDTIPWLIRNVKEQLERDYKLEYPFKRFSIIEVPVQFDSYERAWSQAQETVQPEMILFPEKGSLLNLDVKREVKDQIRWSKHGDREITVVEAQMRTFNNFAWTFMRTEGNYNFSLGSRGRTNFSAEANPYFLFPQIYNFRYNIFSSEWPVANRVIELYLQKKSENRGWEREINGISNNEKAILLLEKHTFKELLADVELRDLQNNIVGLEASRLFAVPEINIGVEAFRDSLYSLLKRNTFLNIKFENMLDTLGSISKTDIRSSLKEWEETTPLPFYSIGTPELTKVVDRGGEDKFVLRMMISNNSDYDGIIHIEIRQNNWWNQALDDPRASTKVRMPAHTSKEFVSVWEEQIRNVEINTMVSGNLPNVIEQSIGNFKQEKNKLVKDSIYVLPESSFDLPGEVIVDNEDSTLFVLSTPAVVGLLPKWLDEVEDTSFKYAGVPPWRPPLQWTATTNAGYYGKYIRSAYVIKSGDGSQTATWKVPVPESGQYDLFYHVYKDNELRWNNRARGEYHFKVMYDDDVEDAYINMRKANEGWEQVGTYFFNSDTIRVVLTDECKLRSVTADAVKIVKR